MGRTLIFLLILFQVTAVNADQSCLDKFGSLPILEQRHCLNNIDFNTTNWEHTLAEVIRNFDSRTNHLVAATGFDVVRRSGSNNTELVEAISFQLQHQAPLYQERDKWHVLRLRAYAFVTLAETQVPQSAIPMLTDALMYVDERMQSVEFGAALRAAASLGTASRPYIPGILQLYTHRFAEEEFSLAHYATDFSRDTATTVQIEATRALGQIAIKEDAEALTVLTSITKQGQSLDKRVVLAANEALATIKVRKNFEPVKYVVSVNQTPSDLPISLPNFKNIIFEDQDGNYRQLVNVIDKPTLLTFFYSRCQNDGKCSTTIAKLAHLQKQLAATERQSEVKILAATFEPQFDTSERLKRYALDRGFQFNGNAAVIRFDPDSHQQVIETLDVAVGYNAGWVNSHGVELVLLDSAGNLAQRYQAEKWDNATVLQDLMALLNNTKNASYALGDQATFSRK